MKSNAPRFIVYELNELAKKTLDFFVSKYPKSIFATFANHGCVYNTITHDAGELHPWSSWPSLYRGVTNDIHQIYFVNQPRIKDSEYPPLWESLLERDYTIGIFGTLQSYPPLRHKNVSFFVPDTFAPSPEAIPSQLTSLQEFNLSMTGQNKGVPSKASLEDGKKLMYLWRKKIVSTHSVVSIAKHVLAESFNPAFKTRRQNLQSILLFDSFYNLLSHYKPDFSTFFCNNLAAMQHRYWIHTFPEDCLSYQVERDSFLAKNIEISMQIASQQLSRLYAFSIKYNYTLICAGAIGQESIKPVDLNNEILVQDISRLLNALNLSENDYSQLLAMQPDICIESQSLEALNTLRLSIKKITDMEGTCLFSERHEPVGNRLNLSLKNSAKLKIDKIVLVNGTPWPLEKAGLVSIKRHPGTAYHTPKGLVLAIGPYQDLLKEYTNSNGHIDICDVYSALNNVYFY